MAGAMATGLPNDQDVNFLDQNFSLIPPKISQATGIAPPVDVRPKSDGAASLIDHQGTAYHVVRAEMTNEQFLRDEQRKNESEQRRLLSETERNHLTDFRHLESSLVDVTTKCDGSTSASVRSWLREIDIIMPQCNGVDGRPEALMIVVARTILGTLRKDVEAFIARRCAERQCSRYNIPWSDLRAHISSSFLETCEEDHLRDEVENTKQSPYETVAAYNRRFNEVADLAYPCCPRNGDQERLLFRAYMFGLASSELTKNILNMLKVNKQSKTLARAVTAAAELSENESEYARLGRSEQSMEVCSVQAGVSSPSSKASVLVEKEQKVPEEKESLQILRNLQKNQNKLFNQVRDLQQSRRDNGGNNFREWAPPQRGGPIQTNQRNGPPQVPRGAYNSSQNGPSPAGGNSQPPRRQSNQNGEVRCFSCQRLGHYSRDCPSAKDPRRNSAPLN